MPVPTPIEDREPEVTARARRLVEKARQGALSASEFAYVRAGFFPGAANRYAEQLRAAGELRTISLLERKDLGDDRVYLYELSFAGGKMWLRLGLAPDERISDFGMTRK